MITSIELRNKFLDFMASKNHYILPSASIIPKEDPTLLFVNSGMYPLVPYLMGEKHPKGSRLANSQICIRTLDIDEVGDNRHLSMFEMLGAWSLGDYFKEQSIRWGFEFLTSPDWLNLDPKRLFVTVYKGSESVPQDDEAIQVWQDIFQSAGLEPEVGEEFDFKNNSKPDGQKYIYRITKKSGADNWWGLPYRGPCGPCSEIYYLLDENDLHRVQEIEGLPPAEAEDFIENQVVEICNHVFMEYEGEWQENIKEPTKLKPLSQKNIDVGIGFERLLAAMNGKKDINQTDVVSPILEVVNHWSNSNKAN